MKFRKIAALTMVAAMAITMVGCGASGNGGSADSDTTKVTEETLPFDGEYQETKLLKVGVPKDWVYKEESNTDEYVAVKVKSQETNDENTVMLSITMQQQPNGGSYGYDTLKETALGELTSDDRETAQLTTVDIGGRTFARVEYMSSIMNAKRLMYVYSTANIEYADAGDSHCKYELVNSISGPIDENLELIEQISESIRLTLPSAYDNAEEMPLEDEATASGTIDITGATIEAPEGWKLEDSAEKSAEYSNPDIHGSSVEFNYSTMTKSAQEWAQALDGNFGGGNTIDQVTIGENTFWHLSPVDGQDYLIIDGTEEKSVIKISTMSISLDQAKPLIETLKLK